MGETTESTMEPAEIGLDFVPTARPGLDEIDVDTEALVFDGEQGAWHLLNPTARLVWQCCDGSGSAREIAADIADIFGVDEKAVQPQVIEALQSLGGSGLLQGVGRTEDDHGHDHGHDHEDEHDDGPRFIAVPPSS